VWPPISTWIIFNGNEWTYHHGIFEHLSFRFYECIIGIDWLDQHHPILDCYIKKFTFGDGEGKLGTIHGIAREITAREI
jgi:hypothetical protein